MVSFLMLRPFGQRRETAMLRAGSLLDHVAASGVPFPLDVVVEVTRQCVTALAYAHSQGAFISVRDVVRNRN